MRMTDAFKSASAHASGVALCALVSASCLAVAPTVGVSTALLALLSGLLLQKASSITFLKNGVRYTSDCVLKIGIVLLGCRIVFDDLISLGWGPISVAIAALASSLGSGLLLAKLLNRSMAFAVLTGTSVGICGAAAATTISNVLPKRSFVNRNGISHEDVALTAITVTALSALGMILLPLVFSATGIDDTVAGYYIGGVVHGYGQAIGAGYALSDQAGYVTTITKLTRVALLMPLAVLVAAIFRSRTEMSTERARPHWQLVPPFLLGFLGVVTLQSLGLIPDGLQLVLTAGSQGFILMGLTALGMLTSLKALRRVGPDILLFVIIQTIVLLIVMAGLLLIVET